MPRRKTHMWLLSSGCFVDVGWKTIRLGKCNETLDPPLSQRVVVSTIIEQAVMKFNSRYICLRPCYSEITLLKNIQNYTLTHGGKKFHTLAETILRSSFSWKRLHRDPFFLLMLLAQLLALKVKCTHAVLRMRLLPSCKEPHMKIRVSPEWKQDEAEEI